MKKTTSAKLALIALIILTCLESNAQTYKPFSVRNKIDIKGSMLVIGNNILGKDNLPFNDNTKDNQDISMQYIDIDSDASTFSSSSADLLVPPQKNGSPTTCYRVAYAALYWGAVLQTGSRTDINKVKFKLPGSTVYNDITGQVVYDAIGSPIVSIPNEPGNTPYACYADVTSLLSSLQNLEGTYTVANVRSSIGLNASTGLSAGWTLYVIYEDPNLHTKSFTSFDGFAHISSSHTELIPISGFNTPQSGPVDIQIAYAALDGDKTKRATKLELNNKEINTPLRSANKFFGSVIENNNGITHPRNPFGTNTLGYDTGFLEVFAAEPEYISNNATSADFSLQVARGQADPIFSFFNAFAVDIIAPDIDLTKIVLDTAGNNIDGADVTLGQNLFYKISYQSVGNDNVTQFTIKDVLPDNVIFDPLTDIDLSSSGGATLQSYDPLTRTLIFNIPNSSVEINDPIFEIRIAVKIVSDCYALSQACSNEIRNQAYATYRGVINPTIIQDEGSFASVECLGTPAPTNFLVDISNCTFAKNEVLCGSSVILTAVDGYDTYSWSTSPTGIPVIGTEQTYTATSTGTYYVQNTTLSTCISIQEEITVVPYGNTITNPVIPFADSNPICPNDGKVLPNIFLCGANATRSINTGISDASSIIWEKLDENSCAVSTVDNCANENDGCTWNQVASGPNYLSNTAGQFRVVINYAGGCFSIFYFNVYQNLLNPTATAKDIICNTPGEITVGGVPGGYEYSIDGINYQAGNVFTVNTPNYYIIYIRQIGVDTNPCIFETPRVYVRNRNFTVSTFITQPYCNGGQGSIKLAANDALPQYYYSIYQGATLINSVGPITASDYTFANLNPGTYTYTVSTDDGCTFTDDIIIIDPPALTATVALTKPLTCTDGELTVNTNGGTPPFVYYVNSTSVSQDSPIITVPTPGVYDITVIDFNNCSTTTSITVNATLAPVFNITKVDVLCANTGNTGSISVNVTNANGNSLRYSIDNGATFVNSPIFNGLAAGTYDVVLEYTIGSDVCLTTPQTITISPTAPIIGTATLTTPYTCITNGTITVSGVSGGNSPYSYSIDGVTFQAGNTFSGLTNGNYTVTIRDVSGCTVNTNPISIAPLNPPTDLSFSNSPLTCPTNLSVVTINSTTGGAGTLEYRIVAPAASVTAYQASNTFSGLAPGTYTFEVKDANDCTYSEPYTIVPLPALTVVGQKINDITCFGASDGAARFTVSGSTGFTYTINGGASIAGSSPINLTGLAAASYTVVITDATTNCQATASVTIDAPATALSVTALASPITCISDGSVVINAIGGWGGYSYSLTQPDASVLPSQPSNTFNNLTQTGTYIATVTDAKGCVVTSSFVINVPGLPTAIISPSSNFCYDGVTGASLIVNTSGGQTPYEYNINGGPFGSSNVFANLTPGNYTIIVRDAYGCTVTLPAQTIAPQLSVNTVLTKELDCSASPDAVITGTITGGYSPFTYAISINGGAYSSLGATGSPFVYTTFTDGTYQFQITDARGCQSESNVITISPLTNPIVTGTTTQVSCNGVSDGSVQLFGSGGSGGYTYSDDNVTFVGTSLFTGLAAGSHTFYIKDSKNCSSSVTVVITEPTVLVATASATAFSCSATNTKQSAVITIAVPTTGTAPYQYSFNNGATFSSSNTLTVNDNGSDQTFTYVVRDANGCLTAAQNITLTRLDPPTDLTFASTAVTCLATASTVTLTNTNGVGPLQYETIAPSPIIVGKQFSNSFAGLTPGTYVFQVTDANGCFYSESYTILPVTPIAIAGNLVSDVLCFGGNNGSGTYTVSGNATVGNYTFTLTAGTLGTGTLTKSGDVLTLSNVVAGTYTVRVTDSATGCFADGTIIISEPANALVLSELSNINANCFALAQVTVIASGGTPSYTYAFVQDGASPAGLYTPSNSAALNPLTNANWDVWVMDNQGCTFKLDIIVATDAVPTIDPVALQCYTGTPISITLSGTAVGAATYSIGGSFQASPTFSLNAPGIYNVSIKDGNGCIASRTFELKPELLLDADMTQDLTCAVDASITLTPSGGTGIYSTYEVSYNGGVYSAIAGSPYTATLDGNYQFRVTDDQGCIAVSNIIIVTPKTTPTLTFTQTNVSCNGGSDGSIVVTAANGIAPYQYSIDNGATFQVSNVFNGLNAAGVYNIVIIDSKNCISTATLVNITEPTLLAANASATAFSCSATNTNQSALITIAVPTTGTAPYQYSFDGGANFSSANTLTVNDNGSDQTFSYVVRDANGCLTAAQNITLIKLDPPTDLTFASAAVTCLAPTTSVTITGTTGGVGALEYQIIAPAGSATAYQSSNIFSGLAPGTYIFRVIDANGCYYSESYTVTPVTPITVTGLKLSDVLCFGDNSGAIKFTVSGYAGTYSSTLITGVGTLVQLGNTIDLTGLIADTYTLEVTDDITGCTATYSITIIEPTLLTFTAASTNVFCSNDESQITVSASGGTASYTYAAVISGNPVPLAAAYGSSNVITVDTNSATNLVWDVYVKDANGCITINPVTIIEDALPTVTTPALSPDQCNVTTGFTITAIGTGLAPLTYSINGVTYQTSPTFTVNAPGSYTVTIKDKNGCTATSTTTTDVFAPLSANAILTKDLTCSLPIEANINIIVSGGNAPYSYEVSYNGGAYVAIAGSPYSATSPGTYQFRITDSNNCTIVTNVITVTAIDPVTASETHVDPTCNGDADGSITLTATSGEAPFTYSIDNGVTFVSSNVFGGLVAGINYDYVVRDSKGCEIDGTIILTDSAPIFPNIIVNGIQCGPVVLGSLDIDITSGGTAPYTYKLYDNSFTEIDTYTSTALPASFPHSFINLNFGDYYITIIDAIGCEYNSAELRIEPAPYLNLTSSIATASCVTGVDVTLNVSGGIPNYDYSIFGQPATASGPIASISYTFTGLDQGTTYVFQVIDSNGCPSYLEITTPIISPIIIDPLVVTNVTCYGFDNGEISFTVDQYDLSTTDLYYEVRDNLSNTPIIPAINGHLTGLTGASVSTTITGLPAGNYTLYVREFNGTTLCSTTKEFQIRQPIQPLASVISAEVNANCNSGAQITLTTTGGTGPYTYAAGAPGFSPLPGDFGTSNVLNLDDTIRLNWDIVIVDANGCSVRINKTITRDADPTINPVVPQCFTGTPISINLSGTTSVGPVTYSIGTGGIAGAYQASPTFSINAAGTYDVFIKDGNGCIATTTYVVQPALILDADLTKELDCTVSPDAEITLTPSGGTGTYNTYEVNYNGGGYSVIAGSPYTATLDGTYEFRVTDDQGCIAVSNIITIDPLTNPSFTETHTNVSCNGGSDGSIVVTASGGVAPYEYS
ncbi:MAG TPA: SprB repeat-containing protein, partial [Yeosuana sp.]